MPTNGSAKTHLRKVETADRPDGARSIFEDIDEDTNSAI
jgi:hypothetical protein